MGRVSVNPLSIIVAVDQVSGFAKAGKIPWNLPEDMKHLKDTTWGHSCIMGRHTYEEIAEWRQKQINKDQTNEKQVTPWEQVHNVLPGRDSFVVTSNVNTELQGAIPVGSLRQAINKHDRNDNHEIFVFGGFRLFTEALSWVDKIYMTVVNKTYHCDRFFPVKYVHDNFKIVDGKRRKRCDFITYQRSR